MTNQIVSCFGIHKYEGINYLHQKDGGSNFVNLKEKSPLTVKNPYGIKTCNHMIPTTLSSLDKNDWNLFEKILNDPLIQVLLPLPRSEGKKFYYIDDQMDQLSRYLVLFSGLSSLIRNILRPAWTFKVDDLQKQMSLSNIQALILTQTTTKQQKIVDHVAKLTAYEPRTVLLTGDPDVIATKPCIRIKTDILNISFEDLAKINMQNIGAEVIRRYCRNEM